MIVAVGAWRGTGATTTALLTAVAFASSGTETWLVEADPAGGVLAGRMRLPERSIGGLERVAFPTERAAPLESFANVAHFTAGVHLVPAPADPFRGFACHQPRMPWVPALRDLPGVVVVDVGTIRAATPAWAVLAIADAVLLVTSPEIAAAVSSTEWVQSGGRVSPTDPGLLDGVTRIVVVDAPGGVKFSRATLQAELGPLFGSWLPWEPGAVDLVHRGAAPSDRRLRRSALIASVQQMVVGLGEPQGVRR